MSQPLAGRRHVTIVGAGIVGIVTASYLQRDGHAVTVVDRAGPGEGCSMGHAGAISPGSCVPLAMPGMLPRIPGWLLDPLGPLVIRWRHVPRVLPWLIRFLRAGSPDRVEEISRALRELLAPSFEAYAPLLESARAEHLIRRTGYLCVYESERAFAKDAAAWDLRRRRGVSFREMDARAIQAMEPALTPIHERAVFLPDPGFCVDPLGLVQALARRFRHAGGRILERDVVGLDLGAGGPKRLRTNAGDLEVEVLVVAAGAWSGRLARWLGSPVPLESHRGYNVTIANPGTMPRVPVLSMDHKFMATPMTAGLRFAGTVELAGLTAPPDYRRADALLRLGRRMFRGIDGHEVTRWMGHRPALPDTLPVIGPSPRYPSVFYAFGHGHTGLTGAAMTGRLIADLISRRPPAIDPAPFRIERFRTRPSGRP